MSNVNSAGEEFTQRTMAPYETQGQWGGGCVCVCVCVFGGMIQHNVALLLKQLVIRHYAEPPPSSSY